MQYLARYRYSFLGIIIAMSLSSLQAATVQRESPQVKKAYELGYREGYLLGRPQGQEGGREDRSTNVLDQDQRRTPSSVAIDWETEELLSDEGIQRVREFYSMQLNSDDGTEYAYKRGYRNGYSAGWSDGYQVGYAEYLPIVVLDPVLEQPAVDPVGDAIEG